MYELIPCRLKCAVYMSNKKEVWSKIAPRQNAYWWFLCCYKPFPSRAVPLLTTMSTETGTTTSVQRPTDNSILPLSSATVVLVSSNSTATVSGEEIIIPVIE